MFQKQKACPLAKQGSILVFSLILFFMMLSIAVSIASITLNEKKSAGITDNSTQAIQLADTASEAFIAKIKTTSRISELYDAGSPFACNGGKLIPTGAVDNKKTYTLSLLKSDGSAIDCTTDAAALSNIVARIKVVGVFNGTVRATEVGVNTGSSSVAYAYVANTSGANTVSIYTVVGGNFTAAGNLNVGAYPQPYGVEVQGNYLYVVNYNWPSANSDVQVYEITNPVAPIFRANVPIAGCGGVDVEVNGNYLYVSCYTAKNIRVVDITNPLSPILTGTIVGTGGNTPYNMELNGSDLYATIVETDNVRVFNVAGANAATPNFSRDVSAHCDGPAGLAKAGNYLYVTCSGSNQMTTFDVSGGNASNPAYTGDSERVDMFMNDPYGIAILGSHAFVANYGTNEVLKFDLTNTATRPTSLGQVATPIRPEGIAIK